MKIISVIFILTFTRYGFAHPPEYLLDRCEEGESYWCTNYETASQCRVLSYCEEIRGRDFTQETQMAEDAKPVLIELYYESFCGGCRNFISTQLYIAFKKLYSTGILDIKLYPYGNAEEKQVGDKWKFSCQHGKKECVMNLYETCVLHLLSHPKQFMPFIQCIEENPTPTNAQKCAEDLKVEWKQIANCFNGSEGNLLQHQMAMATDELKPEHQYVPWIVVNGKHTEKMQDDAQDDLVDFVCNKYEGLKPHACRVHLKSKDRRCYKNEKLNKSSDFTGNNFSL